LGKWLFQVHDDHKAVNIYLVKGNDSALLNDTRIGAADLLAHLGQLARKPLIVLTGIRLVIPHVNIPSAASADIKKTNGLSRELLYICNMMDQRTMENKLKDLKPVLSDKYSVEKIGYFGSYSRNEQTEKSDIDILIEFRKPLGWDFFDLQDFLERELKIKVDLVSVKALKEQLKDAILKQARFV
jgi:predicted nucleotidyltransferase